MRSQCVPGSQRKESLGTRLNTCRTVTMLVSHKRPLFFRIEVWYSSYTRVVPFPKNHGERLVLTGVQLLFNFCNDCITCGSLSHLKEPGTQMDIVCITATCNTDCDTIIQVRRQLSWSRAISSSPAHCTGNVPMAVSTFCSLTRVFSELTAKPSLGRQLTF